MPKGGGGQRPDGTEWHKHALSAGGAGLWEWDHGREVARLCAGAAELLAGDAILAWHDLELDDALARIGADNIGSMRTQLRAAIHPCVIQLGPCAVVSGEGPRRVLLRGSTRPDVGGMPGRTMGVVIDITDTTVSDEEWGGIREGDALDEAAHHGLAAYNAIRSSGLSALVAPARALLVAIGRELARGIKMGGGRPH